MALTSRALPEDGQAAAACSVDLRKTYGSGQAAVHALAGITVTFDRGRFTAVMGPSGSGKSTLMHCMAGLDRPTSGQTFVGGLDIGELDDADRGRERHPARRSGRPEGRPGMARLPGQGARYRRPADPPAQ